MTSIQHYRQLGVDVQDLLGLEHPLVAISFSDPQPQGLKKINETVPSGCVFWFRAFNDEFYTERQDHANCNVGSFTHGFVEPSEVSLDSCADINLMVQANYIALSDFGGVPRMNKPSKYVSYAPLKSTSFEPDVVLFVANAEQAMLVSEAARTIKTMGKPTCSAIPYAYNEHGIAISLGCITNRVRTGLKPSELIVTVPKSELDKFVTNLRQVVGVNRKVEQAVSAMLRNH
jgi:uncharacterized protein (DUF169 family)